MRAVEAIQATSVGAFAAREPEFVHGDVSLRILLPRSADELIDVDAFARDERLPYWADLWPGARALARHLLDHPPVPVDSNGDLRIIELGCGAAALASLVLTMRGYDVLATDYEPEALGLVGANAQRNGIAHESFDPQQHLRLLEGVRASPATRTAAIDTDVDRVGRMRTLMLDWRSMSADVGTFDLVLGADLMYEQRNASVLAEIVPRLLAPGGRLLLADPGRRYLPDFQVRMRQHDFVERELALVVEPHVDPTRPSSRVRILEFTRRI